MEITMLCRVFFNMADEERIGLRHHYAEEGWTYCWERVVSVNPPWLNICFRKQVMEN